MKLIIGILLFFLVYGLLGEAKDAGDFDKFKSPVKPDRTTAPLPYARALIEKYNKAYDSHAEGELAVIVEELIGSHYACFSAHEWDDASLFEAAVQQRPYIYHGDRTDCGGLSLIEIFRRDNDHIRKLQGI